MSGKKRRRGVSVGTVVMLMLTCVVCVGLAMVLDRLSGGTQIGIDARKMMNALTLSDTLPSLSLSDIPIALTQPAARTAAPSNQDTPVMTAWAMSTQTPRATRAAASPTPAPTAAPTEVPRGGTFSLTAGGSVCVETNVRQSGYYKDAKAYDFTEILSLLHREFDSDINFVTLENLFVPGAKVSDTVAPAEVAQMLRINGVDTVACGFSKAFDKKFDGLASTLEAVRAQGLRVVGAFDEEGKATVRRQLTEAGGVKIALLHYTNNLSETGAKALKKDGRAWALPAPSTVAGDVARARDAGAEVVIVSVSWGSVGKTTPTKAQKALAQEIADAGADVLLGVGSRVVQPAQWLTGTLLDGSSHQMLCVYSLGALLCDNRKDGQVAGMLLKLTISVDAQGNVTFPRTEYIPTYIWRFKQDSMYSYRVVAADRPAPDGMESSQEKSMNNAYNNIVKVLGGDAITLRQQ